MDKQREVGRRRFLRKAAIAASGLYRPEALLCAINALGEDRVLYAMGYPFVHPKASIDCFENTPITDDVREKIAHVNAERRLKL